jgi:hypothetical protein
MQTVCSSNVRFGRHKRTVELPRLPSNEALLFLPQRSSSTLNDCGTRFAEFVIVPAETWSECLLACLALLEATAAQLATGPVGPLWDAINLLRSR